MAIDGASVTTVQDSNRPQNLDSGTKIKVANRENEMNRAGQASENGQEVVANFSAAALETSRAAAEVSQGAEKNRLESSTERDESRPQPPPEDREQKIDVMA
ncbi:MAG: hypothetical protein C0613_15380 [Desulfobulbaceae bacterium]|nr:MAG: hypothetical protein C0613_15380 [Desulfobulbaceae bacterium]